jgi:hypothetical protein
MIDEHVDKNVLNIERLEVAGMLLYLLFSFFLFLYIDLRLFLFYLLAFILFYYYLFL